MRLFKDEYCSKIYSILGYNANENSYSCKPKYTIIPLNYYLIVNPVIHKVLTAKSPAWKAKLPKSSESIFIFRSEIIT